MSHKILRDVWLVESSPAPNVQGSNIVDGSSEAAFQAVERFAFPVSSSYVPTLRTGLAGLTKVDEEDGYSCELSLVLVKGLQLTGGELNQEYLLHQFMGLNTPCISVTLKPGVSLEVIL